MLEQNAGQAFSHGASEKIFYLPSGQVEMFLTCQPLQILSNYLKQYGSYGLHKISASGEITT